MSGDVLIFSNKICIHLNENRETEPYFGMKIETDWFFLRKFAAAKCEPQQKASK